MSPRKRKEADEMDATTEAREQRQLEQLHSWHVHCFEGLGFDQPDSEALELACVDWHAADALLARGCSRETAMLILI